MLSVEQAKAKSTNWLKYAADSCSKRSCIGSKSYRSKHASILLTLHIQLSGLQGLANTSNEELGLNDILDHIIQTLRDVIDFQ